MSWEDIIKGRKHCSWCGNHKGWNGKDRITYFVHNELIVMAWKYGTFKTTTNFMFGVKWEEPLPMTSEEFMKGYNQVESW